MPIVVFRFLWKSVIPLQNNHKKIGMEHKQHTFHSIVIEVVTVLLAAIISFPVCDIASIELGMLPFVVVACYVALKFLYHLCISLSAYIMDWSSISSQNPMITTQQNKGICVSEGIPSIAENNEILTKRMELFHYEFQHEQQQYRQQKEKEDDEKLDAIMKYTRKTFKRLDFGEADIFQICECVRYLVTNRRVLSTTEIHIKKRSSVTQISLKNFAWNIAFQYNISGDITAKFVLQTFNEWFSNSTIDTIRKNLRTTAGRHKIEIDENII